MKSILIFFTTVAFLLDAKAVDNVEVTVDKVPLIYNCTDLDSNFFKLLEFNDAGVITEFLGENLYEGGQLKLVSKQHGAMSSKTHFQFASGASLVISERVSVGRGGGRGGFEFPLAKIISAKLATNEKIYYFNCN